MSLSFIAWAMSSFDNRDFALCGRTITSLKRNVTTSLLKLINDLGFEYSEKASKNYFDVSFLGRANRFYIFGGKDESSASLIQGMTLAGVLFDEVALMPRSFVEQALARCSVAKSKMWFNCNPENPYHWFHQEWIKKRKQKNVHYLHFTMSDNPSLSKEIISRYNQLYSGAFYDRFVLGKWCTASGVVYASFNELSHIAHVLPSEFERYVVSCDYGTVNPSSFGLWGKNGERWYRIREYYYCSRTQGAMRTDEEHYIALESLCGGLEIDTVVCDPSAASFMECIRRHERFSVTPAKNDVLTGIRQVSEALRNRTILFSEQCTDSIREFSLYCWDQKSGYDAPIKENDHAMDDIRYFVNTVLHKASDSFFAISLSR